MEDSVDLIITTYNDYEYLDRLLQIIPKQDYPIKLINILICEAGEYPKDRAIDNLGIASDRLNFYSCLGFSRSKALNYLIAHSKSNILIRMDARSYFKKDYIRKIVCLSNTTGAANVGGMMYPVGFKKTQKLIARAMHHPFLFGGGSFRSKDYTGITKSVYLGCFNKERMINEPWYDEKYHQFSEDSHLNWKLHESGRDIYLDSKIRAYYFARDNLYDFFKLCFGYGVARGFFIAQVGSAIEIRQVLFIALLLIMILMIGVGFFYPIAFYFLKIFVLIYLILVMAFSFLISKKIKDMFKLLCIFSGCHIMYSLGLISVFKMRLLSRIK